jgi:hypothetical protein
MKKLCVAVVFLLLSLAAAAQKSAPANRPLSPAEIDRIIKAFTAKETEFRQALNVYGFKRDAKLQAIGFGGQVTGEYHRVSTFSFDDAGKKYEKIILFPQPTMNNVTAEDLEDLSGVNPFAVEADKIDSYNFTYVGQERIDELDLYVFDVAPKVLPDPKKSKDKLFLGRVWVDAQELQIVKSKGKGVPETKTNKFPNVTTYRENVDGKYWFPTYSHANEQLVFDNGSILHIKILVTYTDYKRYRGKVKIIEEEEPGADEPPPATPPKPTPTPPAQ